MYRYAPRTNVRELRQQDLTQVISNGMGKSGPKWKVKGFMQGLNGEGFVFDKASLNSILKSVTDQLSNRTALKPVLSKIKEDFSSKS